MRKISFIFLGLFLWLFLISSPAFAYDLEVDCSDTGCSSSPSGPLFSESNAYPGWSVKKVVRAINNYGQAGSFAVEVLKKTDVDNLAGVMQISIAESGSSTDLYQNSLEGFLSDGYQILSDISAGTYKDYDFTVTMAQSADNDYQDKKLGFDLALGFEIIKSFSSSSVGGMVISSSDAPSACGATAPSAPINLTATTLSDSEIGLSWTAADEPVTHYAVSYGLSSGQYVYGNPNVGKVADLVVSQLASGTRYYFVVYAVNDCASSGQSNEASAVTSGVYAEATGPAPGFEVLGESQSASEEGEIGGGISTGVAGVSTEKTCYWSLVFAFFALVLSSLILSRFKKRQKRQIVVPVVLFLLAYLADRYMHNWYAPSIFCSWLWLISVVLFSLTWLFWWHKSS